MFEKKPKKEPRFVLNEGEALGFVGAAYIMRDTVTGVHYLVTGGGAAAAAGITGITPLLDENGNVVIDKNN